MACNGRGCHGAEACCPLPFAFSDRQRSARNVEKGIFDVVAGADPKP